MPTIARAPNAAAHAPAMMTAILSPVIRRWWCVPTICTAPS